MCLINNPSSRLIRNRVISRDAYFSLCFYFKPAALIFFFFLPAAILDDPMECSRGERLAITLAKNGINKSSNRSTTSKLEVDIFELLRDSEYEMGETSK